ncbi:hypothetical protein ASF30_10875 [Leifsonia sp. Leaf264]|nr:hypothetical protein ASF30_10875 [Leifsonia sp. Leaf264]
MDPQTVKWFESVPGWEWEGTLPAGVDGERRQHLEASLRTGWGSARAMEAFDAFVAREGHAHIPIDHVEGDFKLGRWVMVQRDQYRTGQMSEERREVLESAPGWRWNGRVNSREEKLQALDAYVGRVGDAKVPNAHVEDGVALGQWVGAQRVAHKAGKLPAEFEARLEAYPGWEWRSTRTQ